MGRFFQAQPIELSKDNIYTPPLELMMAANKFKNEELQQQGDNLQTLLDSLPFRYKDIDKDNYTNIQKELNDKVQAVTDMYNKDMTSPEARKKLAELRDEVKNRYSSGDIYNIQKTNDNYDALEKLMEDKKLTEVDKERQRTYFKNFVKENPEGSLKNFFTPGNIVEDVNYMPEMIKDRKEIDPTVTKTIKDRLGALGYINEHSDEYKVSFEKEFAKQWIESHPKIKSMIGTQIDSGLYNDYGNKKLEDGNLDYTKGVLGNQKRYMEMFNKTDTMISDKISNDSVGIAKMQHQWQKEQENIAIEEHYGTNTDVSDRIKKSNNIQDYRDLRVQQIVANLPENIRKKISNQKDLLKYTKGVKGLEKLHQELLDLDDEIERTAKASYDYFATKGGQEEAEKKQKEFNESVKANHRNIRFSLAPKEVENSKIPIYGKDKKTIIGYKKGRLTYNSKSQYDNFYPEQTIGQIKYLPDGRKIKVTGVKFIENSAEPIIMNSPEKTGMSINYNDAKVNLQFTGNLIKSDGTVDETENGSQSFVQRAYFDMSKGVGIKQTNN